MVGAAYSLRARGGIERHAAGEAWSRRSELGTLAEPMLLGENEPAAALANDDPHPDTPVRATWVVLLVLVACFAVELLMPVSPAEGAAPSIDTLLGLGGLDVPNTRAGQWFRLVACTFLHADPFHLLCNGIAIVMAGFLIERRLGWRWFTALYLVGGLAGSLASLASNDGHTVSIGASGAAMALFGGGLFLAQTLPPELRIGQQVQLLRVLIPSLVPVFAQHGGRIDYGAHLGGALAGLAFGSLLLLAYRRAERGQAGVLRFRTSRWAWLLLAPFALALPITAYGVGHVAYPAARDEVARREALLPNDQLPPGGGATPEQVATWLGRYPDDPRVRLFQAEHAEAAGDLDLAAAAIARARDTLPRFEREFDEAARAAFLASFAETDRRLALLRRLLPNAELPQGTPEQVRATWNDQLSAWLARYPDDPRLLQRAALRAVDANRLTDAEGYMQRGLATLPDFEPVLSTTELRTWFTETLQLLADERRSR